MLIVVHKLTVFCFVEQLQTAVNSICIHKSTTANLVRILSLDANDSIYWVQNTPARAWVRERVDIEIKTDID